MEEQKYKIGLTPIAGAVAAALAPSHQVIAQDSDFALEEIMNQLEFREGEINFLTCDRNAMVILVEHEFTKHDA